MYPETAAYKSCCIVSFFTSQSKSSLKALRPQVTSFHFLTLTRFRNRFVCICSFYTWDFEHIVYTYSTAMKLYEQYSDLNERMKTRRKKRHYLKMSRKKNHTTSLFQSVIRTPKENKIPPLDRSSVSSLETFLDLKFRLDPEDGLLCGMLTGSLTRSSKQSVNR